MGERKGAHGKDVWLWELDAQNRLKCFARAGSGGLDVDEADNKMVLTLEHAEVELRDAKDSEDFAAHAGSPSIDHATFDLSLSRIRGERAVKKN